MREENFISKDFVCQDCQHRIKYNRRSACRKRNDATVGCLDGACDKFEEREGCDRYENTKKKNG